MNSHIYTDKEVPAVSVYRETLSDGSHVWNLAFNEKIIGCASEEEAKAAIEIIAIALRKFTMANVLHI